MDLQAEEQASSDAWHGISSLSAKGVLVSSAAYAKKESGRPQSLPADWPDRLPSAKWAPLAGCGTPSRTLGGSATILVWARLVENNCKDKGSALPWYDGDADRHRDGIFHVVLSEVVVDSPICAISQA